jgi:signal transduction histidine kinase
MTAAGGEQAGSPAAPAPEDPAQTRLDRLGQLAPLPLLAAATVLAWLSARNGYGTYRRLDLGLGVAVAAAFWTATVTMRRAGHGPRGRLAGFAGHTGLAAVLVGINPWFGVFAFTGYMLADSLPRPQAVVGFVATALIMAGAQSAGYPFWQPGAWPGYLVVAAVNAVLVLAFVGISDRVLEQNAERGAMIGELNDANARLREASAENAGLQAQLIAQAREAGVLDERQRLAGEIHDTLAQGLIGIVTQLEAAEQAGGNPSAWQHHLDQARALARENLTEARRSVRALRPEQLDNATLTQALDELAHTWTQTSAIPVQTETTGTRRALPEAADAALFRVAQEALTNVAKHARASKVWLTLTYLEDIVLLDVRDDGIGWSPHSHPSGYGLAGMRQRLARIGATLEIETTPGEGTALSAAVPTGAGQSA